MVIALRTRTNTNLTEKSKFITLKQEMLAVKGQIDLLYLNSKILFLVLAR